MCSRYSLTSPHEAVRIYFGYDVEMAFPPRDDIRPTQPVVIVRRSAAGPREPVLVRWGLIPSWVKDPRTFSTLINARSESAAVKPSFRGAMRYKRCLVPANGFYDWIGEGPYRQRCLIRPKGGGLMAMAGLYEQWMGADGSEIETMAILTVAANRTVAPAHDRMPAILPPAQFERWLDCRVYNAADVADLLAPATDDLLEIIELDSRIGSSEAVEWEHPQPARRSRRSALP